MDGKARQNAGFFFLFFSFLFFDARLSLFILIHIFLMLTTVAGSSLCRYVILTYNKNHTTISATVDYI